VHGGDPTGIIVERRTVPPNEQPGGWSQLTKLPASAAEYADNSVKKGQNVAYRVRAVNTNGQSAYSNVVRLAAK
jgi:hypothetical protein